MQIYLYLCKKISCMAPISKSQIKLVRSLQHKKFRDETGLFVAEGPKCVNELKERFEPYLMISSANASEQEIAQMSSLKTPQGIIGVFRQSNRNVDDLTDAGGLRLVLDGVQDPGNLGTIIRTADWFGVRQIVCSSDTVDCYNPKVVQATMGALTRVDVRYTDNLKQWLEQQRENKTPIMGTLLEGENMYLVLDKMSHKTCPTKTDGVLIMGNEGNGISTAVRETITHPIRIPSFPPNAETSESLNVAIATAIVLGEIRRREIFS